jgi:hypothetical protein
MEYVGIAALSSRMVSGAWRPLQSGRYCGVRPLGARARQRHGRLWIAYRAHLRVNRGTTCCGGYTGETQGLRDAEKPKHVCD